MLFPAAILTGCSVLGLEDKDCPVPGNISIAVEVRDSVTGTPAATGATGFIRAGDYTALLQVSGAETLSGGERPGWFEVSIGKAGYRPWQTTGVRVTADDCGIVATAALEAWLQPF